MGEDEVSYVRVPALARWQSGPSDLLDAVAGSFLQGHSDAFDTIGGIPTRHTRYGSLTSAATKVVFGRLRQENAGWVLFRSHYGFDAFYCEPGIEGAHEKGEGERAVGRFRRKRLSPMPKTGS